MNQLPLSESAQKRLADWVNQEILKVGSQAYLAEKLGLRHQTLIKWKNRQVQKLSKPSIEAIARYRNESISQVVSWLGSSEPSINNLSDGPVQGTENPLLEQIKIAPLEWIPSILQASAERLAQHFFRGDIVAKTPLANTVLDEMSHEKLSAQGFADRADLSLQIIESILDDKIPQLEEPDFEKLAIALSGSGRSVISVDAVRLLYERSQPPINGFRKNNHASRSNGM